MFPFVAIAFGAVEQCLYSTGDCSDAGICTTLTDDLLKLSCAVGNNYNCAGTTMKVEYYGVADCSSDVSATCPTELIVNGCHRSFELDECKIIANNTIYGRVISQSAEKYTGSCPAGASDDEPCFSREAESCRILDTSVLPSVAFRACFDEPIAPTVAERVKMTALTGGDYVLSAGKDQAYEFTRVIVNQHKLNEARRRHSNPPLPLSFTFGPAVSAPLGTPEPHPVPNCAEALEHP